MFQVKNGQIIFEDFLIEIPQEFKTLKYKQIYGTSTCGLNSAIGYVISQHGKSCTVRTPTDILSGFSIEDLKIGDTVLLREQLSVEDGQSFWIIYKPNRNLNQQLNWININYENGKVLRICPFTFQYKVIDS